MRHEQIFRIHEGDPQPIKCQYFQTKPVAVQNAKKRAKRQQHIVFVERRETISGSVEWIHIHTEGKDYA
jgi:hypothetical protein